LLIIGRRGKKFAEDGKRNVAIIHAEKGFQDVIRKISASQFISAGCDSVTPDHSSVVQLLSAKVGLMGRECYLLDWDKDAAQHEKRAMWYQQPPSDNQMVGAYYAAMAASPWLRDPSVACW
jgi:hypothetical protein